MKKFIWAMGVVSVGFISVVGALRAEGIKEGQWFMTIVTKMAGMDDEYTAAMAEMENMSAQEKAMMQQMMGGMNMPAMGAGGAGISTTVKQCISNDDPVPAWETDEDCTTTHSMRGNTVHFETVCSDGTSTGDVTYQDETMQGVINSHQTVDGEETDVTIEISGVYAGPCE